MQDLMVAQSECPAEATLSCFLQGLLSREEQDLVEVHIVSCSACLARCQYLESEPSSWRNRVGKADLNASLDTAASSDTLGDFRTGGNIQPGIRVGRFKILKLLGCGGMGEVWEAESTEWPLQRVAIKLLHSAAVSPERWMRFRAEQSILAELDHPGIAKFLEAGRTPDGRPFLVMEWVDGQPLVQFCNNHGLNLKERLGLFIKVCEAIQYSHQRGIIHRDIKPSNVLARRGNGNHLTKVIDFGLAKVTEEREDQLTTITRSHQIVGTLAYMSPEQISSSGRSIDTRTDVYALGVLLFELLTDTTPIEKQRVQEQSLAETLLVIQQEIPERPSLRLKKIAKSESASRNGEFGSSELTGDLDWICLKALEKEPDRRYATVSELAREIQRFLQCEPVEARPPSLIYRWSRFYRRQRLLVAITVIAMLTMVVGFVVTGLLSLSLMQEQNKTLTALHAAEKSATSERLQSAMLAYERGLQLCESNAVVEGVSWLIRALEIAPSDEKNLIRCIRSSAAHWSQVAHSLVAVLEHDQPVNGLAYAREGKVLISASGGSLCVWDTMSLKLDLKVLIDNDPNAHLVFALHPSQRLAVVSDSHGELHLIDLVRRTETKRTEHNQQAAIVPWTILRFSQQGDYLFCGNASNEAVVYRFDSFEPVGDRMGFDSELCDAIFLPDDSQLITTTRFNELKRWKLPECVPVDEPYVSPGSRNLSLAWDLDRERLLMATNAFTVAAWTPANPTTSQRLLQQEAEVLAIVISGDRKYCATSCEDRTVRVWHIDNFKPFASAIVQPAPSRHIAFDPQCKHLVSAMGNQVRIWKLAEPHYRIPLAFKNDHDRDMCQLSHDGTQIYAFNRQRQLFAWSIKTGNAVGTPFGTSNRFELSPDRKRMVYYTANSTELANAETGAGIWSIPSPYFYFRFTDDGSQIILARGHDMALCDSATGKILKTIPVKKTYPKLASTDGRKVVCGRADGELVYWGHDVVAPVFLKAPVKGISSIEMLAPDVAAITGHDSEWIDCQLNGSITFGEPKFYSRRHREMGFCRQHQLLFGCAGDGTVQFFDMDSRHRIGRSMPYNGPISTAAFSVDGDSLVVRDLDNELNVLPVPIDPPLVTSALIARIKKQTGLMIQGSAPRFLSAKEWEEL